MARSVLHLYVSRRPGADRRFDRCARRAEARMPDGAQLAALRSQIDAVNTSILRAIERRGALVLRIAQVKRRTGAPAIDRAREVEMMARLATLVRGPFSCAEVQRIFRAIIAASRSLQE